MRVRRRLPDCERLTADRPAKKNPFLAQRVRKRKRSVEAEAREEYYQG